MPTLRLQFPGRRYHATPWGHHVNEGLIEWPPSPWRLLRALIACGFSTQGWTEIPPLAQQTINKLASVLPLFRLPPASAAHSRHFMPIGVLAKGREQTTLVFDTWANVGDGELLIHWPCELSGEEASLLQRLTVSLGYLGRSESWVDADLLANNQTVPTNFNAFPHQDGERPGREYEQVSLLAAIPPEEYLQWHQIKTESALAEFPLPSGTRKPPAKLLKARQKAVEPYPPNLISCLTKETVWWKDRGWSQPPGSQRVLYWRRNDSLQVSVPTSSRRQSVKLVTTMLLSMTTPSGRRSALPSIARTLPQAELFHRAVVAKAANGNRVHCPELTGRSHKGEPLRHNHRHAHILPVDLDDDGHLDHVIVHAPMGLGEVAQRALRELRRTWMKGGVGELQLAIAAVGSFAVLRGLSNPLDRRIEQILGPRSGGHIWVSSTPYVPPRFLKRSGANTLVGQVHAELVTRGLPMAEHVEVLKAETLSLRHFVRRRQRGDAPPPMDVGFALELRFSKPVLGPLMLGYASHFGLGMFKARISPGGSSLLADDAS